MAGGECFYGDETSQRFPEIGNCGYLRPLRQAAIQPCELIRPDPGFPRDGKGLKPRRRSPLWIMRSGMGQRFPREIYASVSPVSGRKSPDCLLEYRGGMLVLSEDR